MIIIREMYRNMYAHIITEEKEDHLLLHMQSCETSTSVLLIKLQLYFEEVLRNLNEKEKSITICTEFNSPIILSSCLAAKKNTVGESNFVKCSNDNYSFVQLYNMQ